MILAKSPQRFVIHLSTIFIFKLFDTHPITSMMITPETESAINSSLVLISNPWKSEWHKNGVQVPVNSHIDRAVVRPAKLWRENRDDSFDSSLHVMMNKTKRTCPIYQIDNLDLAWLSVVNTERECLGEPLIEPWMLEAIVGALEHLAFVKLHEKFKALEFESLEFDDNARCAICLSFEGEDGNELVFCDGCFLCVHQACYGITTLPSDSWICRQCEAGVKSTTPCCLCPNTGGAMKLADDGKSWCHVQCALWVPEVGFGDIEAMEPVVRLDDIPQARRNLVCSVCRSRHGAPIQCSSKKCKVAFHVTCAFQSNLVMRQELHGMDVRLVGLCALHSKRHRKNEGSPLKQRNLYSPTRSSSSTTSSNTNHQPTNPATARKLKIAQIEADFHKLASLDQFDLWLNPVAGKAKPAASSANTATLIKSIPDTVRSLIWRYWTLKRRSNFNQPLVLTIPSAWLTSANQLIQTTARQAADAQAFNSFRRVRFGLDRARLVVDMVLQREKKKLALIRRMSRITDIQLRLARLGTKNVYLSASPPLVDDFVQSAHLGDSIYDRPLESSILSDEENQAEVGLDCPTSKKIIKPGRGRKRKLGEPPQEENQPLSDQPLIGENDRAIFKDQLIVSQAMRDKLRSALSIVLQSTNSRSLNGVCSQSQSTLDHHLVDDHKPKIFRRSTIMTIKKSDTGDKKSPLFTVVSRHSSLRHKLF